MLTRSKIDAKREGGYLSFGGDWQFRDRMLDKAEKAQLTFLT